MVTRVLSHLLLLTFVAPRQHSFVPVGLPFLRLVLLRLRNGDGVQLQVEDSIRRMKQLDMQLELQHKLVDKLPRLALPQEEE